MSTLAANNITDAAGGNTARVNGFTPTLSNMAGRNRIINGDMRIDQRNNGASVTGNNQVYSVDRWKAIAFQASKFSMQRNAGAVTPPAGYVNYLGITSLSAYTVGAAESFSVLQAVEGFNWADLGWGTASAQSVTLSFWVRSSLTGTFGGALWNSAASRSYPFSYSISAANTWEYKTLTIAGDTTGTWLSDNGVGVNVNFGLGSGATNSGTAGVWSGTLFNTATGATSVVGTNGATFFITGVQLEAGSVATPFERRPYGTELALCQRYFISYGGQNIFEPFGTGTVVASNAAVFQLGLPVPMRVAPTSMTVQGSTSFTVNEGTGSTASTGVSFDTAGFQQVMFLVNTAAVLTAGRGARLFSTSTTATRIQFPAEL